MMNTKLLLCIILLTAASVSFGQQNSSWNNWHWLLGTWTGEGSGQPGKGGGTFTFSHDLDSMIIVRKSHSEYPATDNKPAFIHDDVMIVYTDFIGGPAKAIYFDNEGHTINYQVAYADESIVLTSNKMPGVPVFRLTYTLLDTGTVDTKFEMSQDGDKFITYIEGKSKKTN